MYFRTLMMAIRVQLIIWRITESSQIQQAATSSYDPDSAPSYYTASIPSAGPSSAPYYYPVPAAPFTYPTFTPSYDYTTEPSSSPAPAVSIGI